MQPRKLTRRDFLHLCATGATGAVAAACAPATPKIIEVEKPVVVKEEVVKEVEVEKPVVVKEEVVKEVPVEKVVVQTVVVEKEVAPPPQPTEKAVIRWEGWASYDVFGDQAIAQFSEKNPNITVTFEPRIDGWVDKLLAGMVAGTAQDIFCSWGRYWGMWFQKGQLLDLLPYVEKDFTQQYIDENFVASQWDMFLNLSFPKYSGIVSMPALPAYINHMFLYYDKDAFQEAGVPYPDEGWNKEDWAEACRKLVIRDDKGDVTRYGAWDRVYLSRSFSKPVAWGGHRVNPDDPTDLMWDQPEAQEAFEWYRTKTFDEELFCNYMLIENMGGYESFEAHLAASAEDGCTRWVTWGQPDGIDIDFDISHVVQGPVRRSCLITSDGWGVYRGTKYPDAAWEFTKYLVGEEFALMRTREQNSVPSNAKVIPQWSQILRDVYPKFEGVNLEVVEEAMAMGYAQDEERMLCHFDFEMAARPLFQKVFDLGDGPVSLLADAVPEIEAKQTCFPKVGA